MEKSEGRTRGNQWKLQTAAVRRTHKLPSDYDGLTTREGARMEGSTKNERVVALANTLWGVRLKQNSRKDGGPMPHRELKQGLWFDLSQDVGRLPMATDVSNGSAHSARDELSDQSDPV